MAGRGRSAVGAAVVAPCTSSSVGRVLVIAMSKVGGTRYQVQFFRLQTLNRKIAYCCIRSTYVDVRSCFRHLLLLLLFYCCCCCCCCCCCYCCCLLLPLLLLPLLLLLLLALLLLVLLLHYVLLVGPARCFFIFLPTLLRKLHGDGCTEPSEKFRVRPRYDYEKKHVTRDSKMCCCCRFCCAAPTTDERIHAPVLHDASQIDYCRY